MEKLYPKQAKRLANFNKFYNFFKEYVTDKSIDVEKMALNLERGIFNATLEACNASVGDGWNKKFESMYMLKSVSMYVNLKPDSYIQNTRLLGRLLSKEFNEFELCKMSPEELFPERWEEILEKYKSDEPDETKRPEIQDGILQCGKCKSYKTEYTEKQTRSADEPTTKFCYCHKCGHRWRFC